MSEHFIDVLSVDATGEAALELMQEQIKWLLSRGIIAPASAPDHTHRPYVQGPNIADALEPIAVARMADDGQTPTGSVSVHHDWAVYTSCENISPPPCPRCGADLQSGRGGIDHLVEWFETKVEPTAVCHACGHHAPVGDWANVAFGYCGHAGWVI